MQAQEFNVKIELLGDRASQGEHREMSRGVKSVCILDRKNKQTT